VDVTPQTSKLTPGDVAQKPKPEKKKTDLLNGPTVSNKEQRKADWAIMKEMAKYLWPKVGRRRLERGGHR
jgi:ATP-binding cassette subfamily B (MDR/TAP) protein 7